MFAFFVLAPFSAHAASLTFSPSSGSYGVGKTFTLSLNIESSEQAMNAASGSISFPGDKLEVISISKLGSIFSLWPTEPTFSNSQGNVIFEGITLNPGYIGANGKILTITFRVRSAGVANLSFSSGSILANDGTGSNILDSLGTATFALARGTVPAAVSPSDASGSLDNALSITSTTHPDQNNWYANDRPEFSWTLPHGTLEVRTLIGTSPSAMPSVSYVPSISKKQVDALPDGIYYFAVQVRTASGWSAISRYRVNIDTMPPKPFSISFPHGNSGWDPQPVVFFNTVDGESGISHYEIKIGAEDKPFHDAPRVASNPYVLPARLPGDYTLLVTAVDNAGNVRTTSSKFTIEGIDPPTITEYPKTIEEGDVVKMHGRTYPDSDVIMYIREGDALITEKHTRSNEHGDFSIVLAKGFDPGVYTVTARVKDMRGAQSVETAPFTISVKSKFLSDVIDFILKYLSVAILILLALGGTLWMSARLWFKIPPTIARMRHKAREAERTTDHAFKTLHEDMARHVSLLKKAERKLTKEEAAFLKDFEHRLGKAEDKIAKEIRDISKS